MKTKKKMSIHRGFSKKKKGGLLVTTEMTDLINTHICKNKTKTITSKEKTKNSKEKTKNSKEKTNNDKDMPGLEILTSISNAFQLNQHTLGYLQQMYKNTDDKWFKFIIFNNDNQLYIYIIDGAKINKHSVCMIQGLLDVTKNTNEYSELRSAFIDLVLFKNHNGSNMESMNPNIKNECLTLMNTIDQLITKDIACMPVVAAGSGSVNSDNTICLNDKSGHYKPTKDSMLIAKEVFEANTGAVVFIKDKENKELLQKRYGKNADKFSGICL